MQSFWTECGSWKLEKKRWAARCGHPCFSWSRAWSSFFIWVVVIIHSWQFDLISAWKRPKLQLEVEQELHKGGLCGEFTDTEIDKRVPEKSRSRESVLSNIITLVLTGDLIEFKNRWNTIMLASPVDPLLTHWRVNVTWITENIHTCVYICCYTIIIMGNLPLGYWSWNWSTTYTPTLPLSLLSQCISWDSIASQAVCVCFPAVFCISAGPLYPAGGGDGRHGAGDQHEWNCSAGGVAESHGEVRGKLVDFDCSDPDVEKGGSDLWRLHVTEIAQMFTEGDLC